MMVLVQPNDKLTGAKNERPVKRNVSKTHRSAAVLRPLNLIVIETMEDIMAIPPRMKSEIEKDHLEHIEHRVKRALRTYRCNYTHYADDSGYQMIDALTPPGAADVTDGKRELQLLAEHIIMTIVDDAWAGEDDNKALSDTTRGRE